MRRALWPRHSARDLAKEERWYRTSPRVVVFVAERPDGRLGGFVEATAFRRSGGWEPQPDGYVEGWWVDPDLRRHGVGRRLIGAVEAWCRARGLAWIGSDTHPTNRVSRSAHRALRYDEVEELVIFRKRLRRPVRTRG